MLIRHPIRPFALRGGQVALALALSTVLATDTVLAQDMVDGDADGVPFALDECPYSRPGEFVDSRGCTTLRDSDEDGIADVFDDCPLTRQGAVIGPDGCAIDTDRDGVPDGLDNCPGTPTTQAPDQQGCAPLQLARQRASAAEPEVVVGRPRPSDTQAEVRVETPRPVGLDRPLPTPVPSRAAATSQAVAAPLPSQPAAVFAATGRDVDFVAFESLAFTATDSGGLTQATSALPSPVFTSREPLPDGDLVQSARFAKPVATPPARVDLPSIEPVLPPPQLPRSAPSTPAASVELPVVAKEVPPRTIAPARIADPAAYSAMAQAVARALLGLGPEDPP